jgi:hypothetical protein
MQLIVWQVYSCGVHHVNICFWCVSGENVTLHSLMQCAMLVFFFFSQDLTFKALLLSMDQVTQYGKMYRDAIVVFKIRHFEDRSKVMLVSIRCVLHVWLILFDYACWQIVFILLFHLLPYIFFNTRNCVPWFYGPLRFITA